jgi:hypothetical protein
LKKGIIVFRKDLTPLSITYRVECIRLLF